MCGSDRLPDPVVVDVFTEDGGFKTTVREDAMNSTGKGLDWARFNIGTYPFMGDHFPHSTVLLVCDFHSDLVSIVEVK